MFLIGSNMLNDISFDSYPPQYKLFKKPCSDSKTLADPHAALDTPERTTTSPPAWSTA
jgi:hypothetical protein